MEGDVDKIEQEHNQMRMCFGSFPLNCWSGYNISKRAANRATDVKELLDEKTKMDVVTEKMARALQTIPDKSELLPTTELHLSDAIQYLGDDTVGMVGIWGMGGVGKTTLLKKINNHPYVASVGFDFVIWAVVPQERNLYKLQRDIAMRIGLSLEGQDTIKLQAASLYHFLENKKFLLLLDDLWEAIDLEKLGIPCLVGGEHNVPNCKVAFTTRSEMVCDQMMVQKFHDHVKHKKIKLECLKPEEAWQLFLNNIGETVRNSISSDERVQSRARRVAEKCSGLPLALVVIAQSMSSNKTWHEWDDAINSMNKLGIQELWSEETTPLFRLLKVSYDRLMNEQMRKCFLSCALWPQDYNIKEEDLILCWVGLDLIGEFDDINEAYSRGRRIMKSLQRAGLLEDVKENWTSRYTIGEQYVKMHDVIREMALWIASDCGKNRNKWMVRAGVWQKAAHEEEGKWRETEIASAINIELDDQSLLQNPYCPNLTTLILRGNNRITTIPEGFFQNMDVLTYLDISYNNLKELPLSITRLSQLQYLNIEGNPINYLPKELTNLKELKYIIVGRKITIPHGLRSGLKKLEILLLDGSRYGYWDMESQENIEELVGTKETGVSLKGLGIQVSTLSALEQLSQTPRVTLWKLTIKNLPEGRILDLSKTLLSSNVLRSLQSFRIIGCRVKEILMTSRDTEEKQFANLRIFELFALQNLQKITWAGGLTPGVLFQHLSELRIGHCSELYDVTWIVQLRYLEILMIEHCGMLEKVIDGSNQDDNNNGYQEVMVEKQEAKMEEERRAATRMILPNLRFLLLSGLPSLTSFCDPAIRFPSLQYVHINRCPKLNETPFSHLSIGRRAIW